MYSYFDAHCDTLLKIYKQKKTLFDEEFHVNYKTLSMYENTVQCFALFNEGELKMQDYFDAAEYLKKECNKFGKMVLCHNTCDIDNALAQGKICAVLTAEALGNTPDFEPECIFALKKCGYLMSGLVWNFDNNLCGGADGQNTGLTSAGRATLTNMEKACMIPDVSHMSDKSTADTLELFCKPVVASHSNSASVYSHNRNLSDQNIVRIINNGGLIGINLYSPFVGCSGTVEELISHVERIISLGGADNICIGCDFDGMDKPVTGVENCSDVSEVFDALSSHNYPKSFINAISFNNIYNIFKKNEISI